MKESIFILIALLFVVGCQNASAIGNFISEDFLIKGYESVASDVTLGDQAGIYSHCPSS